MKFEFYNYLAFFWYILTVWSGLAAADGKSGPLTWWGSFFDAAFGLDNCEKVPAENQDPPYHRPAIGCTTPYAYPHGGQSSTTLMPLAYVPPSTTVVQGVGGVTSTSISQRYRKAVDSATYIMQIMTGKVTGDVAAGEYDKKRFKFGTPYIDQQPEYQGYYQTLDKMGRAVPLIAPSTTASAKAFVPPGFDYTTNPAWVTSPSMSGNKVQASYNGVLLTTGGMVANVQPTYLPPNTKLFLNKPGGGFQGSTTPAQSNEQFIRTALLNPGQLTFVSASKVASNQTKAHPNNWTSPLTGK